MGKLVSYNIDYQTQSISWFEVLFERCCGQGVSSGTNESPTHLHPDLPVLTASLITRRLSTFSILCKFTQQTFCVLPTTRISTKFPFQESLKIVFIVTANPCVRSSILGKLGMAINNHAN